MQRALVLPPEYHHFQRKDRYLFIDPRNFIWFSTDRLGKLIVESLAIRGLLRDAMDVVLKESGGEVSSDSALTYVDRFIRGLLNIGFIHSGEYVLREDLPREQLPNPVVMYLHLSNGCNLRCPYCYNQEHRLGSTKERKANNGVAPAPRLENFLRLIDQASDLGFREVKLTGGEALLNKNAMLIARYAKHKGLFVNLLTNATLISPKLAQEIVASVDVVSVSLDSKSPDDHDAIRGRGTHRKVLLAIQLLRQAGLKQLHINGVITPTTLNSVKELLAFAWDDMSASNVTISGSALQVSDPDDRWGAAAQMLNDEQYADLDDRTAEFYRERTKTTQAPGYRNQCGVGNGVLSVDSNGDIYPCQTLHERDFLCGNAFNDGLKHVIETSVVLRDARHATVDKIEECNVCPVRYICASGCRSEAYTREGGMLKRNKALCPTFYKRAVNELWNSVSG